MAGRGVLMVLENGELRMKAARGDKFQISTTIRDRVLTKKESLLIRDAQMDKALKDQMSIVEQKVRSMIAIEDAKYSQCPRFLTNRKSARGSRGVTRDISSV